MFPFLGVVLLLHAYIGWRLVPDLPIGSVGFVATITWLVASTALIASGVLARRTTHRPLADGVAWASLIAAGSLSSLLVLTVVRDLALLIGRAFSDGIVDPSLQPFRTLSAVAVPVLAALATLIGSSTHDGAPRCARSTCRSRICPHRSTASRSSRSATSTSGERSSATTSTRSSMP